MRKLQKWLQGVYDRRITQEFDHIVLIVGDEGMGKSTLALATTWLWEDICGNDPTPETVLDRVVWDGQDEFKRAMSHSDPRSAIVAMDAGRVLYRKDAMVSSQKEIEKDLLDVRVQEYLIILCFQDWDIIPTMLRSRRAMNALVIPERGKVCGFSRESMDEKLDTGDWPKPDLRDTFPNLDGTDLWAEYKRIDRQRKRERMDAQEEEEEMTSEEIIEDIKSNGVDPFISVHTTNKTRYIDEMLIEYEYGISARKAKKIKKVLDKDPDVEVAQEVSA